MDSLQRLHASDLVHLAPELALLIAAVILSLADLLMPRSVNRKIIGWLTMLSLIISGGFAAFQLGVEEPVALLGQTYRVDDFALVLKLLFLAGTAYSVLMSLGMRREQLGTADVGEYYYFYLPAAIGAMLAVSSADLIMMYIGLELLAVTTYIMVGMRKQAAVSSEAAFKYIVTGSISSAFLLYGMSFLYGLSGSTNLLVIHEALLNSDLHAVGTLVYLSFFLIMTGLGFKIAAVPFHAWAPDVYQGASVPVAAFLAVISKAAGIAVMFRLIYTAYSYVGSSELQPSVYPIHDDIFLALAVLSAATMTAGNAMALRQRNLKRLLALSGIANAGYLLVPIAAHVGLFHSNGLSALMYYFIAYLFMNMGAFTALAIVSQAEGHEEMRGFAGLYHRAPATAVAVVLVILSLAGLPVTGGFFGKLFILFGAVGMRMYWLAIVMIVMSAVSFYYYFGIIRQMFMRTGTGQPEIQVSPILSIILWVSALAGVAMGLFPGAVLGWLDGLFQFSVEFFTP